MVSSLSGSSRCVFSAEVGDEGVEGNPGLLDPLSVQTICDILLDSSVHIDGAKIPTHGSIDCGQRLGGQSYADTGSIVVPARCMQASILSDAALADVLDLLKLSIAGAELVGKLSCLCSSTVREIHVCGGGDHYDSQAPYSLFYHLECACPLDERGQGGNTVLFLHLICAIRAVYPPQLDIACLSQQRVR